MTWPSSKSERELFEIEGFITAYQKLTHGRKFTVAKIQEKPDRIVVDKETGEKFGVELTSEYLSDNSVPQRHMNDQLLEILDNPKNIAAYEKRILKRIKKKIEKAKHGYDLSFPLILSVYVNEYESIYMNEEFWRDFAKRNDNFFNNISPFVECVFWPLPNDLVVSVRNK